MTAKQIGHYRPGTDSRNDAGYYTVPDEVPVPDGFERRPLPSVTTVLDLVGDFSFAERWWTAQYVNDLAAAARSKETVRVWHPKREAMVEVHAGQVLLNMLPEEFGLNYGLHWMKNAGARELERRANRGQIVHDAVLDFVLADVRPSRSEVGDFTGQLIERRGYALTAEYCSGYVWSALAWLDQHLDEAYLCECMVVNWSYGWAGTVDMVAKLRNSLHGLVQIDFKTSKDWYPEHRMQASAYRNAESAVLRSYEGAAAVHDYPTPTVVANVYVGEDKVKVMQWGGEHDLFGDESSLGDSYAAFLHLLSVFHHQERAKDACPTHLRSLKLAAPTVQELNQYRRGNHEPNLVLTEGGTA